MDGGDMNGFMNPLIILIYWIIN